MNEGRMISEESLQWMIDVLELEEVHKMDLVLLNQLRTAPTVSLLDLEKVVRWETELVKNGNGVITGARNFKSPTGHEVVFDDLANLVQPVSVPFTAESDSFENRQKALSESLHGMPVSVPSVEELTSVMKDLPDTGSFDDMNPGKPHSRPTQSVEVVK